MSCRTSKIKAYDIEEARKTSIRLATPNDVEVCAAIASRVYSKKWARIVCRDVTEAVTNGIQALDVLYLVAMRAGNVVGLCGLYESPCTWWVWELTWVMVDPRWQKRGIGNALVNRAIVEAGSHKAKQLILTAKIPAYYERFGFVRFTKVSPRSWLMGVDVRPFTARGSWHMEKERDGPIPPSQR